jgi:hypothetical protein
MTFVQKKNALSGRIRLLAVDFAKPVVYCAISSVVKSAPVVAVNVPVTGLTPCPLVFPPGGGIAPVVPVVSVKEQTRVSKLQTEAADLGVAVILNRGPPVPPSP